MLLSLLPSILHGTLNPKEQDESQASYSRLLTKADSSLDPDLITAKQAERQVRAYVDYPRSTTKLDGRNVIITKAHVSQAQESSLNVRFKDGAFLSIDELIIPGSHKISASEYIRGYSKN